MNKYGPSVTKLILKLVSYKAIPAGGGLADGIEFFKDPELRKRILDNAEADALVAIQVIKVTPDNPFGDDDEKIAEEYLHRIEERENNRKPK